MDFTHALKCVCVSYILAALSGLFFSAALFIKVIEWCFLYHPCLDFFPFHNFFKTFMSLLTQFDSRGTKFSESRQLVSAPAGERRGGWIQRENNQIWGTGEKSEQGRDWKEWRWRTDKQEGNSDLQAVNKEMIVWRMNGAAEALLIAHWRLHYSI